MKTNIKKGSSNWENIYIDSFEGNKPQFSHYHMHEYYQISIISQGNVNVLINGLVQKSDSPKLILIRPFTPHYIYCDSEIICKQKNVFFSHDFIANYIPDWLKLIGIFTKNGDVIKLSKSSLES